MAPSASRDPQEILRVSLKEATRAEFEDDELIPAGIIRCALLGLLLDAPADQGEGYRGRRRTRTGSLSSVSPVRLSIKGGIVDGRLDLTSTRMKEGGAFCPLEFEGTVFDGGFSGANCHFSRLSFRQCRFRDGDAAGAWPPMPSIDLSRCTIDAGLEMRDVRPDSAVDHLWIRAPDAGISGSLDLSCSHLRAPEDDRRRRLLSDPTVDALNLARAQVSGDVLFLSGGRSEGRINGRGVRIGGDLWLTGATLEARGAEALFLQSATIGGMLMLDGRADRADGTGPPRLFACAGDLSLRAAEIGDDVHMENAFIAGRADFLDVEVKNDVILRGAVRDSIDLSGCRIGGMLDLSRLTVGVGFTQLQLCDGIIGRSLRRTRAPRQMKLLAARSCALACLKGAHLLETLWVNAKGELRQVGWIMSAKHCCPLDGFRSGLDPAIEVTGHSVTDAERAAEYLRLYGTYAAGEGVFPLLTDAPPEAQPPVAAPALREPLVVAPPRDFFAVTADPEAAGYRVTACFLHNGRLCRSAFHIAPGDRAVKVRRIGQLEDGPTVRRIPRFEGPYILHPLCDEAELQVAVDRRTWPTAQFGPNVIAVPDDKLADLRARLEPSMRALGLLRGDLSFENLTCELLDDEAGRYWGDDVHISLNQFVYRRARWDLRSYKSKPSFQRIVDWWRTVEADWLWPRRLNWWGEGDRLRNRDDYWEPWQLRRNWIYRQFAGSSALVATSRHKIREFEYRPQPFEQAVRVARAEGREDYATHFEMLKQRIEWRLQNRRIRWPLAFIAILAAYLWLWHIAGHSWVATAALVSIWIVMLFVSSIEKRVAERLGERKRWLSKWIVVPSLFSLPAIAVYVGAEWWLNPLHFFIALAIFFGLRLVSVFSHAVMRFMFGYLRRPVRAIVSLIVAFLVGWWGVDSANDRQLLVVDANPVASLVGDGSNSAVIGSERQENSKLVASDIHCGARISEPLYALDVLIPLIDLREESRCEVGRAATAGQPRPGPAPGSGLTGLVAALPDLTVQDEGFWGVMKALYAVAGWLIVSLSILTFAHINRAPREAA